MSGHLHPSVEARVWLAAEPQAVAQGRALLATMLDAGSVEGERKAEALLVVSELVSNAVAHGSRAGDEIGLEVSVCDGRVRICVRDAARGPAAPHVFSPDEERLAGRGLNIVERLADWSERVVDDTREVCAELRR